MVIKIFRQMRLSKYFYHIVNDESFIGTSKYTYGIRPFNLKVTTAGKVLELKQTSWFLKLINSLPVFNMETFTPFNFYLNNKKIGKTKKKFLKPIFYLAFDNKEYTIIHHNNNTISVIEDGNQIALYKKEDITKCERNIYHVDFNDKEIKLDMILLICIFIDVVFYPNNLHISYLKYEKDIVLE